MKPIFLKYPSIKNYEQIDFSKFPKEILTAGWYSTEKIHGANMSIIVTPTEVVGAKRSGFITDDDKQFKRVIVEQNERFKNIVNGAREYLEQNKQVKQLNIFGEAFGFGMQKMDYKQNKDRVKDFLIFDVFRLTKEDYYVPLPLEEMLKYFGKENLVPIREIGRIQDLIKTDNPEGESFFGGAREGFVYKMVNPCVYDKNQEVPFYNAIKYKGSKFKEVSCKSKTVKTINVNNLPESDQKLFEDVSRYVTTTRVENVMSHHGFTRYETENIGQIIKETYEDVVKEYPLDITPIEKRLFGKMLNGLIVSAVKQVFNINN